MIKHIKQIDSFYLTGILLFIGGVILTVVNLYFGFRQSSNIWPANLILGFYVGVQTVRIGLILYEDKDQWV